MNTFPVFPESVFTIPEWLFTLDQNGCSRWAGICTSVKGVKASANLYSLIECAKINGLEPYAYLRYVFTELPKAGSVEALEALLPGNLKKDQIMTG